MPLLQRPGAVDESRRTLKPEIPSTGDGDIPIRDEIELEERWNTILEAPVKLELVEDQEDYAQLWVRDA